MSITPIYIFSLPRAGSTLLQRLLMGHTQIDSIAEPWLLLPLVYALRQKGIRAEYDHHVMATAMKSFVHNLAEGEKDYYREVGKFALALYKKNMASDCRYFVDKTPRYYWILDEINKIFPHAKFIFLFRHPLAIYSSILRTWCKNRFLHIHNYRSDIYEGMKCLSDAYKVMHEKKNVIGVKYEDLVRQPENTIRGILDFLELDLESNLSGVSIDQDLRGDLGDKTGRKKYKYVTPVSLESWKSTFNTPYRKSHATKYIQALGKDILAQQGYELQEIIHDIKIIQPANQKGLQDRVELGASYLCRCFNVPYPLALLKKLFSKNDGFAGNILK